MSKIASRAAVGLCLVAIVVSATGCATHMVPVASFTLLAEGDLSQKAKCIEITGEQIEESENHYWILTLIFSGKAPTHESVLARALERHNADMLVNAELKTSQYGIPYIFMVMKTTVVGTPAKFVDINGGEK